MTAEKDVPDGTSATCLGTMVGVPAGTSAVVRHNGPNGLQHESGRVYWLELDDYIHWSHGDSPHKGYWAVAAEFEVVTPPVAPEAVDRG